MSFRQESPYTMPSRSVGEEEVPTTETKPVKMTPELLITAPRRSPAVTNSYGTRALYTVSTYDLESHSETVETMILDIYTRKSRLFTDDKKNVAAQWLVDSLVLWQRSVDGGATEVWIGSAVGPKKAYLAAKFDAPISDIKVRQLSDGNVAFAFAAPVSEGGTLLNPEKLEKPKSSAREYESASVRFWDTYVTRYSSTLWYTVLEHVDGKYKLSKSEPVNALAGTEIHFPSTPTSELHSGGSYEIASTGLLLTTEDPEIDPAENDVQGLWYIKLKSFIETKPHVQQIYNSDKAYKGSIGGATFSFDGKYIAYMQQRAWKYPDREAEVFMTHLDSLEESYAVPCKNEEGTVLEPQSLMFSNDGTELYVLAQYKARAVLFTKQINGREGSFSEGMKQLPLVDSIAGISRFNSSVNDQRLFITTTSYTNPSVYVVSHPPSMAPALVISDQFEQGSLLGLKSDQVQEIHVKQTDKDGNDYDVQSWVVVPSDFDPSKKYPLLMLIHGGPLGAWTNTWSTRWNPAVFSEQGYVVVNPNPTGSTSFGWNLTKGIFGEWGGACYTDLEATFSYVEANMPFVDTKNAVLGGGSFGGYMTNWVAGQKLGAKMKALFSHDGIFTMTNMLSSDVPWMLDLDVGKHLWEDTELWNKYSPSSFTQNWNTPMLVIHSDNDYRCPITEGLATYNVCKLRGVRARFLNFPDENHFVQKKENSLQWYRSVLGWINEYTGVNGTVELKPALTRGSWKGKGTSA